MFSNRKLYLITYLIMSLVGTASAATPLDRISRLEHQIGELHQLHTDVVPLIEKIETRLIALEQRRSGSPALETEVAALRRSLAKLSQKQQISDLRRSALEAELRNARRTFSSPPTVAAQTTVIPSPAGNSAPKPKLFRGDTRPIPAPVLPRSRPVGPDDAEYWKHLKDEARRSVIAGRQRNGLTH